MDIPPITTVLMTDVLNPVGLQVEGFGLHAGVWCLNAEDKVRACYWSLSGLSRTWPSIVVHAATATRSGQYRGL